MKKNLIALIMAVSVLIVPLSVSAEQAYFGLGLMVDSGNPNSDTDRFPMFASFETKELWRFSLVDTAFKAEKNSSSKLKALILSAERIWVYKIQEGFSLIGAFGPGYFAVKTDNPSGTGGAFGIAATASLRYAIKNTMFIDGALQYRNAAVEVDDNVVNGGYQGLLLGFGFFF